MKEYTYSEARQRLAALLEPPRWKGFVRIRRMDGTVFVLRPVHPARSPLEVPTVDLGLTREQVLAAVREGTYLVANPDHRKGMAETQSWWWRELKNDPRYRDMVGAGS